MTFGEVLLNIAISIIASLTIWCFLQLYSVGARKKINRLLMIVRDECIAFEKYLKYNDYDNALQMTRRILDKICEVFDTIKPLNYSRKKRLLINTLLNNIYVTCHRFTQKEIGYSDNREKEACCEKTMREVYSIGYFHKEGETYPDPLDFEPITSVTAKILIDLNLYFKTINKTLKEGFFFNSDVRDVNKLKKYYKDLISVDLFKGSILPSIAEVYYLTNDTLTQKKYYKIIDKLK